MASITSRNETPVYFAAGKDELFGILTEPTGEPNGMAILTLFGAGPFPTLGKNQVRIRMARELAELGYHVLRIDYRGFGESGGEPREAQLSELWTDDAIGAVRFLEAQGIDRIVLVGVCFGARTGLAIAPEMPGLAGLAMIAPPVGDANHRETILQHSWKWYLKRGLSLRSIRLLFGDAKAKRRRATVMARLRRSRPFGAPAPTSSAEVSRSFLRPVEKLIDAKVPMLFLYGRHDDFFVNFERALDGGPLGTLLERAGDRAQVLITDQQIAGLASVETQDMLVGSVVTWAASVANRDDRAGQREGHVGLRVD